MTAGIILSGILLARIIPVFLIAFFSDKGFVDIGHIDPLLYLGGAKAILKTGTNPFNFFPPLNFPFIATFLYLGNGRPLLPLAAIAVIGWLTAVVMYLISRELFGSEKTALGAALIIGLYPNFIFYGISFYSETLALFWIACSLMMLVKYFHRADKFHLVSAGMAWALASQTRAGLNFFALFIGAVILLQGFKKARNLQLFHAGLFLGCFFVTFFAVGIAVQPIQGAYSFNSNNGIAAVALGVNRIMIPGTDYGNVKGNVYYDIDMLSHEQWPVGSHIDPREILSLGTVPAAEKLITFIFQDPVTYIANSFGKLSCFWAPEQYIISFLKVAQQYYNSLVIDGISLMLALLYAGIVCGGIWGASLSRDPLRPVFISFIMYYCVLIFFTVGNSRLRLPLMPLFMIYCAYFLSHIKNGLWRNTVFHKWSIIIVLIFLFNSIYKYPELLLSPAEIHVQKIEICNQLGFPKTALALLQQNGHKYTKSQFERLNRAKAMAQKKLSENNDAQ